FLFFSFSRPSTPVISTLSLHDALPICAQFRPVFQDEARDSANFVVFWSSHAFQSNEVAPEIEAFRQNLLTKPEMPDGKFWRNARSEEHTSELQSRSDLVCRLLLEKKKK